jgi:predicted O-linked N-acetylglucosamine transferase (SPINDLY family)
VMAEVRQRLSVNRATHPLFDMQRFTRNLEDALVRAWATRMKRNATGASVEN